MAEKRMFSKKVTDSDPFIELSSSAQALYFHLNQSADDDGFNNQIQNAMFKAHATLDDLKVLMCKNFIIRFESGVIVIRHWRLHNTLRKDRYTPTNFQTEIKELGLTENGEYEWLPDGCQMVAKWLPNGCHSIDKVSIDKNSVVESSKEESSVAENSVVEFSEEPILPPPHCEFPDAIEQDLPHEDEIRESVMKLWNAQPCTKRLTAIPVMHRRNRDLMEVVHVFGYETLLNEIRRIPQIEWFKKQGEVKFDWYIDPNNFIKVLEGNYDKAFEKKEMSELERIARNNRQVFIDEGMWSEDDEKDFKARWGD